MEPMDKEDEQIQQQMAETRASLTEKLETLEQKVVGTVEGATTAVTETVDVIKDSVQGTVTAVNDTVKESVETVKDWFDIRAHVQERPWLMVGGSVAVGYCLGTILSKAPQGPVPSASPSYPVGMQNYSNGGVREEKPSSMGGTQTPIKSALSNWAPEIDKLKSLALGVLFGTARELVTSSVPEHVGEHLKEIFDSVTKKAGGEPISSSDLSDLMPKPQETPLQEGSHGDRYETEAQRQSRSGYSAVEATSRRW